MWSRDSAWLDGASCARLDFDFRFFLRASASRRTAGTAGTGFTASGFESRRSRRDGENL